MTVSWTLRTGEDGPVVLGPVNEGVLADGRHSISWDGRDATGQVVPDGTYVLTVTATRTTDGMTGKTTGRHSFTVDTVAPALGGVTVSTPSIYPVRDGYRDAATFSFTRDYESGARFEVADADGKIVRAGSAPDGAFTWDGRRADGSLVPAGTYRVRVTASDMVGNASVREVPLVVSHKRLVTHRQTVTRTPGQRTSVRRNHACTVRASSTYSGGYRILDRCRSLTRSTHELRFTATAPRAFSVRSIAVSTTGAAGKPRASLSASWYHWSKGAWVGAGVNGARIWRPVGTATATRTIGNRASGVVRSGDRKVSFGLGLREDNVGVRDVYDIKDVRVTFTYQRLE